MYTFGYYFQPDSGKAKRLHTEDWGVWGFHCPAKCQRDGSSSWCFRGDSCGIFLTKYQRVLGGLMSYGALTNELYRAAGVYAGRILRGATSAALPVMPPARFEFVINKTTADELRIKVPKQLLARRRDRRLARGFGHGEAARRARGEGRP
jgi:hypothetical protein